MGENVKHKPRSWFARGMVVLQPMTKTVHSGTNIEYDKVIARAVGSRENARLIAAAPDFVAASEALLIAWQKLIEVVRQDDRIEEIEFNEFMALRSAVAKARGIHSWEVHKHLKDLEARP